MQSLEYSKDYWACSISLLGHMNLDTVISTWFDCAYNGIILTGCLALYVYNVEDLLACW